jgi:hypothetical protein
VTTKEELCARLALPKCKANHSLGGPLYPSDPYTTLHAHHTKHLCPLSVFNMLFTISPPLFAGYKGREGRTEQGDQSMGWLRSIVSPLRKLWCNMNKVQPKSMSSLTSSLSLFLLFAVCDVW